MSSGQSAVIPYHLSLNAKAISQMQCIPPLTSAQMRSGRALLRWSAEDLARASRVGLTTIRRAELAESATSLTAANDVAIRAALENAGVEFIDENGGGPGVRLRKPVSEKSEK